MFRIIKVDLYRLVPRCLRAADILRDVSVPRPSFPRHCYNCSARGTMRIVRPPIDHALFGQGFSWSSGTHSYSCRDPVTGCGRCKGIVSCQARDMLLVHRVEPGSNGQQPVSRVSGFSGGLCKVTATCRRQVEPRVSKV